MKLKATVSRGPHSGSLPSLHPSDGWSWISVVPTCSIESGRLKAQIKEGAGWLRAGPTA